MSRTRMVCPGCGNTLYSSLICLKCQLEKDKKYKKTLNDICKMIREFQELKKKAKIMQKKSTATKAQKVKRMEK